MDEIKIKTKATLKGRIRDFHGGPVVKNPPASAEDRGSIPGPGRSHGTTKPESHTTEACVL